MVYLVVLFFLHDNIVPKPDLALELGKSISLTEAKEEVVAREVHATHARIVSESKSEPTQRRQSGIAFRDSFIVSKKRSSDSSKKLKPHTRQRVMQDIPVKSLLALCHLGKSRRQLITLDQFLYDKPTKDDHEKSKVVDESDSTIPDPSLQTVMSTPPVIAPFTEFSYPKPSSLVTPPPINTEAITITTSLPEITPFIAL
ncbi:hypothetical protein Tco_0047113 [Tanacetum coccineum]